ncbi:MAG: ribosomal protein S18-alanine N-acetyltransferase [Thermomicrobiales bacterium]
MNATPDGNGTTQQQPTTPELAVPRYRLERMSLDDVPTVSEVERRCFSNPWPMAAYRRELENTDQNYYILIRDISAQRDEAPDAEQTVNSPRRGLLPISLPRRNRKQPRKFPVVGFAGMWNAFDEAHLTTIAIDEPYRGRGLGEALLIAVFDEAIRRGINWVTLEVRVSNESAQALYRKWGFTVQGTRKRYYSDNNEDAYIMWSQPLSDHEYQFTLGSHRAALITRLGGALDGLPDLGPEPGPSEPAGKPPWE